MTLDEAIKNEEKIAEENQRVVDTGVVFDDVTIDMLYCDDTEVIEEHLANYQSCAEKHRQLAEWLKELKQLKSIAPERQTCEVAVSKHAVDTLVDELARAISDERCCISRGRSTATIMQDILDLPPVNPQHTEAEIQKMQALEQAEIKKAYELGKAEQR